MNRAAFIQKQIEYTRKRELQHIANKIKDDATYKKELIKLYNQSMDRITKEVESAYMRFAGKEGLSMDDAMRKVSTFDVQAFAKKAAEYVKNKDFSAEANEQLRLYNLKMRMSRLELMKREMLLETMKLADKEIAMLENKLGKAAMEELERQAGILNLPQEARKDVAKMAKNIVHADLHSAIFSQRVWANNRELLRRLEAGVERSILRGYNPKEWSRSVRELVRDEMGDTGKVNSLYAANRIAITETARVQTEIAMASYRKGGFKQYVWIAEPTACHICAPYDGEIFDIHGSQIGGDLPPMHPFCRCSVAAFESREDSEYSDDMGYNTIRMSDQQYGKKIGKHASDYEKDPSKPADRRWVSRKVKEIFYTPDEVRSGPWRGQKAEVDFYIKGEDVVITNQKGEFISILKGGILNERVKNARKR